jgi:soluble lytic murein transglycosylase-like protein
MTIKLIIALISINTAQFQLPKGLLRSVCTIESSLKPMAVHHDDGGSDSLGLCQIKIETAKEFGFRGTRRQLMNPYWNTYYAAKYLKHQIARYHGNLSEALVAYNWGSSHGVTSDSYSKKIISLWKGQK